MFFKIELEQNSVLSQFEIDGLENLLQSGAEGTHLPFANRATLYEILDIPGLGARALGYIKKCISQFSFLASFENRLAHYVVVRSGCSQAFRGRTGNWVVPLNKFCNSHNCLRIVVLGENLNDARIYLNLSKLLSKHQELISYFNFSFDFESGGGHTTGDVLIEKIEQGRFVICLVDSDKASENSPIGQTANKCQIELDSDVIWRAYLIILPAKSIENILPTGLVRLAVENGQTLSVASKVDFFIANDLADIVSYVNLKKGTHLSDVFKYEHEKSVVDWKNYSSRLAEVGILNHACVDAWACQSNGPDCSEQGCRVAGGYGGKLVRRVSDWLLSLEHTSDTREFLSPHDFRQFGSIADQIVESCIASPVQRS